MSNYKDYSVVATTFNDSKEMDTYLNSICSQSLKPIEIVIADGGSKDDTVAIIEAYKSKTDIPIRVLGGRRLNIAEGYNEAIRAAKAPVIGVTGVGNIYEVAFF